MEMELIVSKKASLNYFDIYPWQLNEGELVILAGLPQAPSIYDLTQNYDLAKQRQHHVLDRMVENGVLTEEQAHEIFIMEVRNYEKMISGIKPTGHMHLGNYIGALRPFEVSRSI